MWKKEIVHLRGLIERCENLLRSITDGIVVAELERMLAAVRERLADLLRSIEERVSRWAGLRCPHEVPPKERK